MEDNIEKIRHKLGHMAVDESGIGVAEDKVNKIKNKTLGTLTQVA